MAFHKLALDLFLRDHAARTGVCLLILGLLPSALGVQEIAKVEQVELQPLVAQVKRHSVPPINKHWRKPPTEPMRRRQLPSFKTCSTSTVL